MTRASRPSPDPLVSVMIPVFNGERHIGEAVTSVLAQSYRTLEILVIDDGSIDRSVEAARGAADGRCRVLRQPKSGAAAARNLGVADSSGSLLAFLDADDLWTPDKLARQVRALHDDPGLDMVFGHYVTFGALGYEPVSARPLPGYALGTMLIRRDRYLKVGPLPTQWRVGEFIDWYARAEEAGLRHAMLPEVVMRRRVHEANLTGGSREARVDYARIVRAVAARRGRLGPASS